MFDRSRNDRAEGPVTVEITLEDGRELQGQFIITPGRTLTEVLNGTSSFMEFEPFGGQRTFVAKAALHAIKPLNVSAVPNLAAGLKDAGVFDPFAVLGLKPDATADEVRHAYLGLAKIYHPDRYAAADLPGEVRDYLAAMARRINAAHDAVQGSVKTKAARQDAIFTTTSRS